MILKPFELMNYSNSKFLRGFTFAKQIWPMPYVYQKLTNHLQNHQPQPLQNLYRIMRIMIKITIMTMNHLHGITIAIGIMKASHGLPFGLKVEVETGWLEITNTIVLVYWNHPLLQTTEFQKKSTPGNSILASIMKNGLRLVTFPSKQVP